MRGKFIVFDGGEGAGKSSVLKYVAEQLGDKPVRTREPGGSPFSESIRGLILADQAGDADPGTLFLLFWAARHEHITRLVQPTLAEGKHVLCDRFDSSTWAHQICAEGHTKLAPLFKSLRRHHLHRVRCTPDHYIIFDGDPRVLLPRAKRRAQTGDVATHFDNRELAYHDAVRDGFLDFVTDKPHTVVNAEEPREMVEQKALALVRALIA